MDPPAPGPAPEARVRIEMTETELIALINRMVPERTWMKMRSDNIVRQTFARGLREASAMADQITHRLIRAYDNMNDPNWRRRV